MIKMPRVSQEVAAQTRQKIIDASFSLLVEHGNDALTFTKIAQAAKVSRSGINAHFKKKSELLDALKPMLKKVITDKLDFTSGKKFFESWKDAIDNDSYFRNVIAHANALCNEQEGVAGLIELIGGDDENPEDHILMAIGYAVIHCAKSGNKSTCCK